MAIETDQLVLSNLFDLWRHFERFQGDEVGVTVVENYYPTPLPFIALAHIYDSYPRILPSLVTGGCSGRELPAVDGQPASD